MEYRILPALLLMAVMRDPRIPPTLWQGQEIRPIVTPPNRGQAWKRGASLLNEMLSVAQQALDGIEIRHVELNELETPGQEKLVEVLVSTFLSLLFLEHTAAGMEDGVLKAHIADCDNCCNAILHQLDGLAQRIAAEQQPFYAHLLRSVPEQHSTSGFAVIAVLSANEEPAPSNGKHYMA